MIYAPTARRIRRVFGRRRVESDGRSWIVELRADGVWVRMKLRRKWCRLSFHQLIDAALGQEVLAMGWREKDEHELH